MQPKASNKKRPAVSWFYCDNCDIHVTTNEKETHENICGKDSPSCEPLFGLEYIQGDTIYTCSVERLKLTIHELDDMPTKYVSQMIFISEGAIRLSHLRIGQNVLISKTGDSTAPPLIRTVWPLPERFLTTVFVTPEDYASNWEEMAGNQLKIKALVEKYIVIANRIKLKLVSTTGSTQLSAKQMQELTGLLRHEIKHRIYSKDSVIHFNFFNKMIQFEIVECISEGKNENFWRSEKPLEEGFSKLKLGEEKKYTFFKVVQTTQIDIILMEDVNVKFGQGKHQVEVTTEDIGGLCEEMKTIDEFVEIALSLKEVPRGVKVSRGMLLYGPTGAGKTLMCEVLCNKLRDNVHSKIKIVKVNTSEIFSRFLGETEKNLAAYFEEAFNEYPNPALIIVEDVQNLCPKYETTEMAGRITSAFVQILDSLGNKKEAQRMFVLATTSNIEAIHPAIRRCGRLDSEVEISAPTPQGRKDILKCLLRKVQHNLNLLEIEGIAADTHAFVGADLSNLVYNASLIALKSKDKTLNISHMRNSLTFIKPSAMREILIENPNVHWSDIGGQHNLKMQLKQIIEWPLLHANKLQDFGIKPPRGLLMFGPPGCSKTMIAKALATESRLNFLSIKGPELFSMWVGESERAVREVFRKARQVAPAIVFFDEIDAISGERSDGNNTGTSVKERVLTQLLTELDGVESLHNVTVVAATNRPDLIDKALLRPGRIDRIVYVGLPDESTRREIFKIKLRTMPLDSDVDIEKLVTHTEGYSGAELQAVCQEAALKALEENFEATNVKWAQFEFSLKAIRPRTNPELLRIYDDYV